MGYVAGNNQQSHLGLEIESATTMGNSWDFTSRLILFKQNWGFNQQHSGLHQTGGLGARLGDLKCSNQQRLWFSDTMLQSKPSKIGGSKHWVENLLVKCQDIGVYCFSKKLWISSATMVTMVMRIEMWKSTVSNVAKLIINSVSLGIGLAFLL